MSSSFESHSVPTMEQINEISIISPHSPFNTPAYAKAAITIGLKPCTMALRSDNKIAAGCLGFFQRGILSRRLKIATAPNPSDPELFWGGVGDFCRKNGVWELDIHSFASESADIPSLPNEIRRHARYEFILDLNVPDPLGLISTAHRRNIKRAEKTGLIIRRTRDIKAAGVHLDLITSSMQRRLDRGEDVWIPDVTLLNETEAMLRSGAAEIFQAIHGANVLSSTLVLWSPDSAYYQTAGSSPEGMKSGASMYLMSQVATILREEGCSRFNLGGAGLEEEGLLRFKQGFGAKKIPLEAATFSMVSSIKNKLLSAIRSIRGA